MWGTSDNTLAPNTQQQPSLYAPGAGGAGPQDIRQTVAASNYKLPRSGGMRAEDLESQLIRGHRGGDDRGDRRADRYGGRDDRRDDRRRDDRHDDRDDRRNNNDRRAKDSWGNQGRRNDRDKEAFEDGYEYEMIMKQQDKKILDDAIKEDELALMKQAQTAQREEEQKRKAAALRVIQSEEERERLAEARQQFGLEDDNDAKADEGAGGAKASRFSFDETTEEESNIGKVPNMDKMETHLESVVRHLWEGDDDEGEEEEIARVPERHQRGTTDRPGAPTPCDRESLGWRSDWTQPHSPRSFQDEQNPPNSPPPLASEASTTAGAGNFTASNKKKSKSWDHNTDHHQQQPRALSKERREEAPAPPAPVLVTDTMGTTIIASRYKTKMCHTVLDHQEQQRREGGTEPSSPRNCPYEHRCMFAHSKAELRTTQQNMDDGLTTEEAIKQHKNKEFRKLHPHGFRNKGSHHHNSSSSNSYPINHHPHHDQTQISAPKLSGVPLLVGCKRANSSTKPKPPVPLRPLSPARPARIDDDNKVCVKGYRRGTTKETIEDFFSRCGAIGDYYGGNSNDGPFCYLGFDSKGAQQEALKLNGESLDGDVLIVNPITDFRKKANCYGCNKPGHFQWECPERHVHHERRRDDRENGAATNNGDDNASNAGSPKAGSVASSGKPAPQVADTKKELFMAPFGGVNFSALRSQLEEAYGPLASFRPKSSMGLISFESEAHNAALLASGSIEIDGKKVNVEIAKGRASDAPGTHPRLRALGGATAILTPVKVAGPGRAALLSSPNPPIQNMCEVPSVNSTPISHPLRKQMSDDRLGDSQIDTMGGSTNLGSVRESPSFPNHPSSALDSPAGASTTSTSSFQPALRTLHERQTPPPMVNLPMSRSDSEEVKEIECHSGDGCRITHERPADDSGGLPHWGGTQGRVSAATSANTRRSLADSGAAAPGGPAGSVSATEAFSKIFGTAAACQRAAKFVLCQDLLQQEKDLWLLVHLFLEDCGKTYDPEAIGVERKSATRRRDVSQYAHIQSLLTGSATLRRLNIVLRWLEKIYTSQFDQTVVRDSKSPEEQELLYQTVFAKIRGGQHTKAAKAAAHANSLLSVPLHAIPLRKVEESWWGKTGRVDLFGEYAVSEEQGSFANNDHRTPLMSQLFDEAKDLESKGTMDSLTSLQSAIYGALAGNSVTMGRAFSHSPHWTDKLWCDLRGKLVHILLRTHQPYGPALPSGSSLLSAIDSSCGATGATWIAACETHVEQEVQTLLRQFLNNTANPLDPIEILQVRFIQLFLSNGRVNDLVETLRVHSHLLLLLNEADQCINLAPQQADTFRPVLVSPLRDDDTESPTELLKEAMPSRVHDRSPVATVVWKTAVPTSHEWSSAFTPHLEGAATRLLTNNKDHLLSQAINPVCRPVLANLMREPENTKFHTLRQSNAKISGALKFNGVVEWFNLAGFVEEDGTDGTKQLVWRGTPNNLQDANSALSKVEDVIEEAKQSRLNSEARSRAVQEGRGSIVVTEDKNMNLRSKAFKMLSVSAHDLINWSPKSDDAVVVMVKMHQDSQKENQELAEKQKLIDEGWASFTKGKLIVDALCPEWICSKCGEQENKASYENCKKCYHPNRQG